MNAIPLPLSGLFALRFNSLAMLDGHPWVLPVKAVSRDRDLFRIGGWLYTLHCEPHRHLPTLRGPLPDPRLSRRAFCVSAGGEVRGWRYAEWDDGSGTDCAEGGVGVWMAAKPTTQSYHN